MAGHIHKDAFQILTLKEGKEIPVLFTPSISSVYRNNPGIKVYEFDNATFAPKNFDVYYLPLENEKNKWVKEYNFNAVYQPTCKDYNLLQGFKRLKASNDLIPFYQNYYMVSVKLDITANDQHYYQCSLTELTSFTYRRCLGVE
jgi:hypothetical protein